MSLAQLPPSCCSCCCGDACLRADQQDPLRLVFPGVVWALLGPSPKGISVWKQYNSLREKSVFTPIGWVWHS